ncbi:MAG: ABC transporter ATP-binding protein, partial [Bacteroidaceae bacterium]|nr:ABC transporter ATP-binding protein [Bacteroidaceae bacterium]
MECENPVFRTESLTFSYPGGEPVLKDLSLELAEGKITTIIGANGCGKSTLLNLLTRNLTPDSGSIYLNDRPVGEIKSKDYATEVASVPQHNTAPPD